MDFIIIAAAFVCGLLIVATIAKFAEYMEF